MIIWYILECLFYHFYFTTLVYYFAKKYLEKTVKFEERQPYITALILAYAFFCLAELGIFIYMVNLGQHHCKCTLPSHTQKSQKLQSTQS